MLSDGAGSESAIAHAAIDLDWLAVMHPQSDPYGQSLAFANLAAAWPAYAAAQVSLTSVGGLDDLFEC